MTALGGFALATSVALAGAPAGSSPGVPASTVTTFGAESAHYCVTAYAPNATISVRNEKTGAVASLHTNHKGSGCADVPVDVTCGERVSQLIVATGVGADGNPGTSSARADVPGNIGRCVGSPAGRADSGSSQSSSLSAPAITLLAVGGVLVIGLCGGGLVLARRRRSAAGSVSAE
jgi:hypothetical protein